MTKYERAALAVVNKVRRAGKRKALKRLPHGIPNNIWECPIARALDGGHVAVDDRITVPLSMAAPFVEELRVRNTGETHWEFACPRAISEFVTWFDKQATPAARALALKAVQ